MNLSNLFGVNDYNDDFLQTLLDIFELLSLQAITEDDIWQRAIMDDTVPHFANIMLIEHINAIESAFEGVESVSISSHVNACDSHLFVNNEQISSLDQFKRILDEAGYEIPNDD